MWAFWEIAKSLLGSIISSRIGQIIMAVCAGWIWGWHSTTVDYEKRISAEKAQIEAAYKAEIQREEYAAREIAEAATRRAEDDAEAVKDMQEIIDEYTNKLKEKPDAKTKIIDNCSIDSNFIDVVRKLSNASNRHTRAARRTKKLR